MSWYVLYVKSRYEIKVATTLENRGIETYCPVIKELRQWSDRKKIVTKPLFNSYVFVRIKEVHREQIFEVPGVVRYLYWLGKPALVHDKEIETIKKWLEEDQTEKIEITGLSRGDQMTIKSGIFKDREAKVIEISKNKMRLILTGLSCTVTVQLKE